MCELLRSNEAVLLNFAEVVLRQVGITCLIADQHISVIEGSIGAFPRRLLVHENDEEAARAALIEAGLGQWLTSEADAASPATSPAPSWSK
jgi:hypothetical protein